MHQAPLGALLSNNKKKGKNPRDPENPMHPDETSVSVAGPSGLVLDSNIVVTTVRKVSGVFGENGGGCPWSPAIDRRTHNRASARLLGERTADPLREQAAAAGRSLERRSHLARSAISRLRRGVSVYRIPDAAATKCLIVGPYRLSQYDTFTRNVLAGCRRSRSRTSPWKLPVPSAEANPCRPSFHTAKSVEPGLYSQRKTTLD
jgi:hypothetical protein